MLHNLRDLTPVRGPGTVYKQLKQWRGGGGGGITSGLHLTSVIHSHTSLKLCQLFILARFSSSTAQMSTPGSPPTTEGMYSKLIDEGAFDEFSHRPDVGHSGKDSHCRGQRSS